MHRPRFRNCPPFQRLRVWRQFAGSSVVLMPKRNAAEIVGHHAALKASIPVDENGARTCVSETCLNSTGVSPHSLHNAAAALCLSGVWDASAAWLCVVATSVRKSRASRCALRREALPPRTAHLRCFCGAQLPLPWEPPIASSPGTSRGSSRSLSKRAFTAPDVHPFEALSLPNERAVRTSRQCGCASSVSILLPFHQSLRRHAGQIRLQFASARMRCRLAAAGGVSAWHS